MKSRKYIIEVGNNGTYLWKKINNEFKCMGQCGRYGELKTPQSDFVRVRVGFVEETIEKMGYEIDVVGSSLFQVIEK